LSIFIFCGRTGLGILRVDLVKIFIGMSVDEVFAGAGIGKREADEVFVEVRIGKKEVDEVFAGAEIGEERADEVFTRLKLGKRG
jgi:hypothetical protein